MAYLYFLFPAGYNEKGSLNSTPTRFSSVLSPIRCAEGWEEVGCLDTLALELGVCSQAAIFRC